MSLGFMGFAVCVICQCGLLKIHICHMMTSNIVLLYDCHIRSYVITWCIFVKHKVHVFYPRVRLYRYILCTQTPCKTTCPNHVLRCFQLWNHTGTWTWGSSVHWDFRTLPCRSSFSRCCNCVALSSTLFLIVEFFFLFFKSFIYSSIISDLQRILF